MLSWLDSATWTEDAYFALPDTNHLLELADGRLIVLDMPTLGHQRVVRDLARHMTAWNDAARPGEVLFAPYPVRLKPGLIREPDVFFYLAEHRDRLAEQSGGPPDLAIEVLSPSTRRTDLGDKLAEYAEAGVPEYWVVDPDARAVEVYRLAEGRRGQYAPAHRYTAGQALSSPLLPGFALPVEALFATAPAGDAPAEPRSS